MSTATHVRSSIYRKSPDEAFASFKREESDSSVIDPETEGSNSGLDKQKCSAENCKYFLTHSF